MNVESILRQKGTEVATITPETSIKRAAFDMIETLYGVGYRFKEL
jgi:CBS domain-containing protein